MLTNTEYREWTRTHPGCICVIPDGQPYGYTQNPDGSVTWRIDPDCEYHRVATEHPDDHRIPWNCPTFWDGCNCDLLGGTSSWASEAKESAQGTPEPAATKTQWGEDG